MKSLYYLLFTFTFVSISVSGNFSSKGTGNWNILTTWDLTSGIDTDGVPDSDDSVTIGNNHTITIQNNDTANCLYLQIGENSAATTATISFTSNSSVLNVVGDVAIYQSTNAVQLRTITCANGKFTIGGNLTFNASNSLQGTTSITLSTGILTIVGDINFNSTSTSKALIDMTSGSGTLNIGGNINLSSTGNINIQGPNTTVNYNGSGAQTIRLDVSNMIYRNLLVSNTSSSGAILNDTITKYNLIGDITITGKLKTSIYPIYAIPDTTWDDTIILSIDYQSLLVDSGGTLVIGAVNTTFGFPSEFNITIDANSTIVYAGGNQNVKHFATGYGNLTLQSGSGIATKTLVDSTLTILGNLTIGGDGDSVVVSANKEFVTSKDVSIESGGLLKLGSFEHTVGGDWNYTGGNVSSQTSKVTFTSNDAITIGGPSFNKLIIDGDGIKTASYGFSVVDSFIVESGSQFNSSSYDITVADLVNSGTISSASNIYVSKNFDNSGTFNSTEKVILSGTSAQTFNNANFYNLSFTGNGIKTPSTSITVANDFTIGSGATVEGVSGQEFTIGDDWTNNGTFTHQGSKVTFTGNTIQTIDEGPFGEIVIDKTGGSVSLDTNITCDVSFTLQNGSLEIDTYTISGNSSATFTLDSNTTLNIKGANIFPASFTTYTLNATSTVEYSGDAQTISDIVGSNYWNLVLSGTSTKTLGGTIGVDGNCTVQPNITIDPDATNNFSITGAAGKTLSVYGILNVLSNDFTDHYSSFGTVTLQDGSTVAYIGDAQNIDSTLSYKNLVLAGSGIKSFSKGTTISIDLNIDSVTVDGGTFSHTILGDVNTNDGSDETQAKFTSTGSITFSGTSQNIGRSEFKNVTFAGSETKYATNTFAISGNLTINSGAIFDAGEYSHTIQGNFTNSGTFEDSTSTFTFEGTSQQQISGRTKFHNLILNDTSGLSLGETITVDTIEIQTGLLTTNSDTLILTNNGSMTEPAGKPISGFVKISKTVVVEEGKFMITESFGGIGIEITTDTVLGQTTVLRRTGVALSGEIGTIYASKQSIKRYFDVSSTKNANLDASVTIYYDNTEVNSINEVNLGLWESFNSGSSWKKYQSVVDTVGNSITASGINRLSRFTASDSLSPVSIKIRSYRDKDGDITSTDDWIRKKWRLELRKDSLNGSYVYAVDSDTAFNVTDLAEGTYYAVEADSLPRGKHLGQRINNDEPTSDTLRYYQITALGGNSYIVDFANFFPNKLSVKMYRDMDIDFSTSSDRIAKKWKIALYVGTPLTEPVDSIDSDTIFTKENLGDGSYLIKIPMSDSTRWKKLGHTIYAPDDTTSQEVYYTAILVTLDEAETKTAEIVVAHPAEVIVKSFRDVDGDSTTTSDYDGKSWKLSLFRRDTTGLIFIDSTNNAKTDTILKVDDLREATYVAVESDSLGNFVHYATFSNGTKRMGTQNTDSVTVVGGDSMEIWFVNFNPNNIFTASFEDIDGNASSSNDRTSHSIQMSLYKQQFSGAMEPNTLIKQVTADSLTSLNIGDGVYFLIQEDHATLKDLKSLATGKRITSKDDTLSFKVISDDDSLFLPDTIRFTLSGGRNVYVDFLHYNSDNVKFRTFLQDDYDEKGIKIKVKKGTTIPMPNAGNVRDTAFKKMYSKKEAIIGIAQTTKENKKLYGWMGTKSGSSVKSSLPQNGYSRGFDVFRTKQASATKPAKYKAIVGKYGTIKPGKYNYDNKLLGEQLTFVTNIAASDAGITKTGFGDLVYTGDVSEANGKTLREIKTSVDTILTYWTNYYSFDESASYDTNGSPPTTSEIDPIYDTYASLLETINFAFTIDIDTISTSPLKITGAKEINQVPFLQMVNFRNDDSIIVYDYVEPTQYEVFQNYPNPFNPITTISFVMLDDGYVSLKIYNILGEELLDIVQNEFFETGGNEIQFDASYLPSGVYYYRFFVNGKFEGNTLKMVLIK